MNVCSFSPQLGFYINPLANVHNTETRELREIEFRSLLANPRRFAYNIVFDTDRIAMAESSFKLSLPLEERISLCARLRKKHSGKIPLVLEKAEHSNVPEIVNKKLLSPDITVGQVEDMIRRHTNLAAEKSIYVFVRNSVCPIVASISAIYEEHKDDDGFLYMTYSGEDLFFTMKTALGIADSIIREKGTRYIRELPLKWIPYLATLEKLTSLSELHTRVKESLEGLLEDRMYAFCTLITCFGKEADRVWVMKLRAFTNFEVRRHFMELLFPSSLGESQEFKILVDRSSFFEESVKQVSEAKPLLFKGAISVMFKNEFAVGDGVFREWMLLVCKELFDPSRSLFKRSTDDLRRFSLNPLSYEDENHLELFRFAGRIIALALKHEVQVGYLLDPLFFLQLRGQEISLEDVLASDKALHQSFKTLLEMNAEECDCLGLSFEIDTEQKSGKRLAYPLCLNGENVAVTRNNRDLYVALQMKHRFQTQIENQLMGFSSGFQELLSAGATVSDFFGTLDLRDLDSLLGGSYRDSISVYEWMSCTVYENLNENDETTIWFWKALSQLNGEQRRNLLYFWTSIRFLPMGGFDDLPMVLTLAKDYEGGEDGNRLPNAQTCLFTLLLPHYESYDQTLNAVLRVAQEDFYNGHKKIRCCGTSSWSETGSYMSDLLYQLLFICSCTKDNNKN
ncbi:unnamed protein product [Thlaspi arvense]|uniref:HECT-type E3 ubiquitin transferase n=1 Tax=Thlaspi arvense TaxID=13288 RepID=A0AAU9S230_THLAR|nr:unnamed protein product [Thlaspi arvense]